MKSMLRSELGRVASHFDWAESAAAEVLRVHEDCGGLSDDASGQMIRRWLFFYRSLQRIQHSNE